MRTRFLFAAFSTTLAAAACTLQACSGGTESTPSEDAGVDAPVEAAKDTGVTDTGGVDSATCDLSADFSTRIPDAEVLDGATTTGICMGCMKSKCAKAVDGCNKNCSCQGIADKGITCYSKSGGDYAATIACIGSIPSDTKAILALLGCAQEQCGGEPAGRVCERGE